MSATTALAHRFDAWVRSGDLTLLGLARFRILFAVVTLLTLPDVTRVAAYPDAWFAPPLGPLRVLPAWPPEPVLVLVQVLWVFALVALALGWRTTAASVSATVLSVAAYGLLYSTGKIDHNILAVLLPLVLAWSRWGERLSLDALRRSASAPPDPTAPAPAPPLRYLALLVGLAFFSAAVPKVVAGWLDPSSQAVQYDLYAEYYTHGRTELLAPVAIGLHSPLLWETADWATVVLEGGLLLAVLSWRAWRTGLAITTLFHLGVYLAMNISFSWNVLVYAAFVPWDQVRLPTLARRAPAALGRWWGGVVAVAVALAWTGVLALAGDPAWFVSRLVIFVGAAVAVWYLIVQARTLFRRPQTGREEQVPTAVGGAGSH